MTLAEFHSKPLATKADAAAMVTHVPFDKLCAYVADADDSRVSTLLAGLWEQRAAFTREQIVKAAVCALFPAKGYMRRTTSSSALMLAKAIGCEQELQRIIRERWGSIRARECNEVVLGLSDTKDVSSWIPTLWNLFESNNDHDVKTELVRAVNNIVRQTESPDALRLRDEFLLRMPTEPEAYPTAHNFQFIDKLRRE